MQFRVENPTRLKFFTKEQQNFHSWRLPVKLLEAYIQEKNEFLHKGNSVVQFRLIDCTSHHRDELSFLYGLHLVMGLFTKQNISELDTGNSMIVKKLTCTTLSGDITNDLLPSVQVKVDGEMATLTSISSAVVNDWRQMLTMSIDNPHESN